MQGFTGKLDLQDHCRVEMGVASLGVKGGDWQEKSGGDGSTSYSLPQKGVSHGAEAESSQSLQGKKKFRG